ncbi:MAG: TRAP transporter substrate-binding protein DctP [Deltaproteobacteria bacterium]|nr:TRAP transporter substrate-binding protein DctP [Deltaproteobacteria bacterium]
MTRSLSLVAALALLSTSALGDPPAATPPVAPPVSGKEVVIRLATVAPDGSPWAVKLQEFKKKAEAAAPGQLKVKVFLGGALGDENETVLATKRGQLDAVGASTGALASQVPELNVLELPYLFNNFEEVDHIASTVIKTDVQKYCSDRGLEFGFWSENGFRGFGGRFQVKTPADLKGRKMRSQENPIHLAMWRDLGASPVPIPTTEALTSLQTGVVDGYDQAALYLFAASWNTASKYYTVSNHIYQGAAIVYNKAAWDSWSAPVQKALQEAAAAIENDLKKQVRAMTPILLDNLKTGGIEVYTLNDGEKAAFQSIAVNTRASYLKGASKGEKDLAKKIETGLAAYRKK